MDTEFKKLLNGGKWATDATDNIDPDSTSITPVLNREDGFPASYSRVSGNVPDRRRINQLLRELTGGAFELVMGVSPYDAEVNYPLHAISAVAGRLYRAKVANGPDHQNVTTPDPAGNAVWEAVSGAIGVPDKPFSFEFDNSAPGQMTIRWKDGRDNGARITSYRFQWRNSSTGAWVPSTPITTQFAEYTLTSVAPNTQIFVQARAMNEVGLGDWAMDDTGEVVIGTVPGGGASIGLLATPGDAQASLTWQQPATGGHPIQHYIVQWRPTSQTFTSGNQTTVSDARATTVTGLTNGTEHFFRVAAVNQIGQGSWSNIANATPMTDTPTVFHPTLLAPTLNAQSSNGAIVATTNLQNSSEGTTADVTRTDWQIKASTISSWSGVTPIPVTSGSGLVTYTFSGLTSGITYDVRYRVYTSANNSNPPYSPSASVAAVGAVPDQPVSVSGSAWWRRTTNGIHQGASMSVSITPGSTNGSPVTGYGVRATFNRATNTNPDRNIGGQFTVGTTITSTASSLSGHRIRLSSTPQYGSRFTVFGRVRNANGWGPWRQSGTFTVGGDTP